ncbi:MAG: ComEC/Rec2 family competence protein, partial [Paracoccaceae bacterium]
ITTASLSPPSGPVEPGGFDFQRFAWFRTLGAIGYTRMPVLEIAPPDRRGAVMWLAALRMRLARSIRARIPGEGGAFAAAILTGDRSAIDPATTQVLRDSNLAHLLAISGLHMGLLTGFVFAAIRYALAGVPYVALRVPVSRIAALGAFFTALGYLLLSGGNIATQRAFVMVAVMLLAVMIDRRALTLRAVALAAVIILVLRPESLIEAGFQMSFAATTALVAAFALMRDRGWFLPGRGIWRGLGQRMLALFLASLIAGIATAPISAFHFNRVAQFGLIANLASVPVMGLVIMPAAVLAVLVSPFGLAHLLWWVMGRGIAWVLFVATRVAALEDAVFHVPTAPGYVLALITGGALLCALLRGGVRVGGLAPVLAGLLLWSTAQRPLILISENGRLVGVKTDSGRWLSRAKGNGFVATSWLRSDGDASPQDVAAARIPSGRRGRLIELDMAGSTVLINLERKIGKQDIAAVCDDYALVIAPRLAAGAGQGARNENGRCNLITGADLAAGGSIAVTGRRDGKFSVLSAQDVSGRRLWTR